MLSMKLRSTSVVLSGVLLLSVSGCGSKDQQKELASQRDQSPVVAQVGDESITQADVDYMLERMLKGQAFAQADDSLRQKVLDSLISSRAMKIQMESLLTPEAKEAITRSVKAYEEELYVKEYLANHVVPEPVTLEMIQAYYDKHPEEFGAETVRDFQLLMLGNAKDQQARDKFLAAVPEIKTVKDWNAAKKQWAQSYALQYQEGRARPGLFDPALEQAISRLSVADVSDLIYVNDQIYLVKVTKVTQLTPKPLTDVSANIRKQLAAQQLRSAVKKASEDVLTKVEVKMPSRTAQ
jgi:parvulin-like peptidyl-prolyl isomerase